jgi:hypothetical protein
LRCADGGNRRNGELVGALVHLMSGVRFAPDSDWGADMPPEARYMLVPGDNHYDILYPLINSGHPLGKALLKLSLLTE